jgi:hypothetical protein
MRKPPAPANGLLWALGYARENPAVVGDLLEEFRDGRSAAWYWRQTLLLLSSGVATNIVQLRAYWMALVMGFLAQFLLAVMWWYRPDHFLLPIAILQLAGVIWLFRVRWRRGNAYFDRLKRITTSTWSRSRTGALVLVSVDTFTSYLSYLILGYLFLPHVSRSHLLELNFCWFGLCTLAPALLSASRR